MKNPLEMNAALRLPPNRTGYPVDLINLSKGSLYGFPNLIYHFCPGLCDCFMTQIYEFPNSSIPSYVSFDFDSYLEFYYYYFSELRNSGKAFDKLPPMFPSIYDEITVNEYKKPPVPPLFKPLYTRPMVLGVPGRRIPRTSDKNKVVEDPKYPNVVF